MKTIQQVLEETKQTDDSLESLVDLGLLEESKMGLVQRALTKENITKIEKDSLVALTETLINEAISGDYLSKFDDRKEKNAKDIPAIIVLKRKAIRVFPDNQKVGLYYSQQLDRYVSIPYGGGSRALGMELKENRRPISRQDILALPSGPIRNRARELANAQDQMDALVSLAPHQTTREILAGPNGKEVFKTYANTISDPRVRQGVKIAGAIHRVLNKFRSPPSIPTKELPPKDARGRWTSKQADTEGKPVIAKAKKPPAATSESFNQKLRQIREQRQQKLDEVWPVVPAAVAAARAAGPILGKVGSVAGKSLGRAGRSLKGAFTRKPATTVTTKTKPPRISAADKRAAAAAAAASVATSASQNNSQRENPPLFKPTDTSQYQITQGGRRLGDVGALRRVTQDIAGSQANQAAFGNSNVFSRQRQQMQEQTNNLEIIKELSQTNNAVERIQIGESQIDMTTKIAKKIIRVYESLNRNNKTKMERMLNEDADSFRKAINFSIRSNV